MATVLEELMIQIGVDVDDKSIKELNKGVENTINFLKKITIAASAAGAALVGYTMKTAAVSDENIKFAKSIGVSYQELQALGFAAERETATFEDMKSSLFGLSSAAGQAAMGAGSGVEAFARLGVNFNNSFDQIKSADVLLRDVMGSIQGFSKAEQIDLIQKLGISPGILLLIQKGVSNLNSLTNQAREYGIEQQRMADSSEATADNLTNLKFALNGLLIPVRQFVLDLSNELVPQLNDWIKSNKDLMKQRFAKFIVDLTENTSKLKKNIASVVGLIKVFAGGVAVVKFVSLTSKILSMARAFASIGPAILLSTGPIGVMATSIAGMVSGLALWFNTTEKGRETWTKSMNLMKEPLDRLEKAFISFVRSFGVEAKDLNQLWSEFIKPVFENIMSKSIILAFKGLAGAIDLIALAFTKMTKAVDPAFKALQSISNHIDKVIENANSLPFMGDDSKSKNKSKGDDTGFFDKIGGLIDIGTGSTDEKLGVIMKSILPNLFNKNDSEIEGKKSNSTPTQNTINNSTITPQQSSINNSNTSNNTNINAEINVSSTSGDPGRIGMAIKEAISDIAMNGLQNQTINVLA